MLYCKLAHPAKNRFENILYKTGGFSITARTTRMAMKAAKNAPMRLSPSRGDAKCVGGGSGCSSVYGGGRVSSATGGWIPSVVRGTSSISGAVRVPSDLALPSSRLLLLRRLLRLDVLDV